MSATDLTIVRVSKSENWDLARDIRQDVFVIEQECPPEEEWDQYDNCSRHLVALEGDFPAATARWRSTIYEGMSVAKLERIAVRRESRGKGLGRAIVLALMDDARGAGFDCFILHAQQHLQQFYESLGFSAVGPAFEEVGIHHVLMVSISCKK